MEMVWGGLVETNRVGFCVLVYPRSSWREEREHSVDVCVCPPATSYSYFFYWLCGVGVGGPGQPRGQQVWPRCATVLERIKAGLPRSEEHAASHLNSCRTVAGASIV